METIDPAIFQARCYRCGEIHILPQLALKPTLVFWLRMVQLLHGQRYMIEYAAKVGFNFDRLECARCYGPGYSLMKDRPKPPTLIFNG